MDVFFDFQRMQLAVAFDDKVDFLRILISVVMQNTLFRVVMIRFYDFSNRVVFEDLSGVVSIVGDF